MFQTNFETLSVKYEKLLSISYEVYLSQKISQEDKKTVSHYLLNLCTVGVQNYQRSFSEKYLDIIDGLIKQNQFVENGFIPARLFKTAITMGLFAHKNEWCLNFFKTYSNYLTDADKKAILPLCKSIIAFETSFFNEEKFNSEFISVSKSADIQLELGLRKLKIKLFVKENDWLFVQSLIEQLTVYIHRKKKILPESHVNATKQFLFYIKMISPLGTIKNPETIYSDIEADTFINFMDKQWLISMLNKKRDHLNDGL